MNEIVYARMEGAQELFELDVRPFDHVFNLESIRAWKYWLGKPGNRGLEVRINPRYIRWYWTQDREQEPQS